jgi:Fur family transcriptional regulator, peroxide stress response regulator
MKSSPRAQVDERLRELTARCRAEGMNLTPQRLAIYRALLLAKDHPTPEALFDRVRPGMPTLSLATIYKTLEALAQLGLVSEMPATGQSRRFDANQQPHHHLVCDGCGSVSDYRDPALDAIEAPGAIPGFRAERIDIHVHGRCRACARAGRGH